MFDGNKSKEDTSESKEASNSLFSEKEFISKPELKIDFHQSERERKK
jgi:hypothetical protein